MCDTNRSSPPTRHSASRHHPFWALLMACLSACSQETKERDEACSAMTRQALDVCAKSKTSRPRLHQARNAPRECW